MPKLRTPITRVRHIKATRHAVERFFSRFPERVPEGCGYKEVAAALENMARRAVNDGQQEFRNQAVEVCADGVRIVLCPDAQAEGVFNISTVMGKKIGPAKRTVNYAANAAHKQARRMPEDDEW